MPANFKSLLNNRDKDLEKIKETTENMQRNRSGSDDRFWKLEVDKSGNGFAIIRFLPAPPGEGEDTPFIRYWEYGFKGPGGWYIEKSRKTISREENDPVFEYKGELWNTGTEENQNKAKKMKTNMNFVSNILVIKDPANPENEGKVFLYRYGKKIFDMISTLMTPDYEGDDPVNAFDFFGGANFRLKAYNNDAGYRQYDKSSFEAPSAVSQDEDELEAIWNKEYPLKEFVDPENFKSYADLQDRLHRVMKLGKYSGNNSKHIDDGTGGSVADDDDDGLPDFSSSGFKNKEAKEPEQRTSEARSEPVEEPSTPVVDDDDDDDTSFFQSLADD